MTETLSRPNRYAAHCIRCNARIPAGEGLLARTDTGWAADHPGPCPPKVAAIAEPTPVARIAHDGVYLTEDGTIYKVQQARQGSGNLYAKRLIITTCTDPGCGHPTVLDEDGIHRHGHFEYAPGAIHTLRADQQMTTADAAAFGALYGICGRCGADLTDERSIARGTGPVCAGYFA